MAKLSSSVSDGCYLANKYNNIFSKSKQLKTNLFTYSNSRKSSVDPLVEDGVNEALAT